MNEKDVEALTARISDQRLEAIAQLCQKATPGPWKSCIEGRDCWSGSSFIQTSGEDIYLVPAVSVNDHDFIASARQDVPELLAEVLRLRGLLQGK